MYMYFFVQVTSTMLPIQLLSGVYGMNFQLPDGTPGIPELIMPHGYSIYFLSLFLPKYIRICSGYFCILHIL